MRRGPRVLQPVAQRKPRPAGRAATLLPPLLSLLPAVVLLVVVQSLSPVAQRLPTGAARFDLAGAWLATEPGALPGTTSWLTAPTLGRLQLGLLLSGAVLTESIYALPGLGRLMVDGILSRDYPVAQAAAMFVAGIFVMVNFLVDIGYLVLDPRVRRS